MPTFEFTSPEGKSYEITGPEGATKEQAFGILQKQIGAGAPAAPAKPKELGLGEAAGQAVKNLPQSAGKLVTSMIEPFVHPVQTAQSLRDVSAGALQKMGIDPSWLKAAAPVSPLLGALGHSIEPGKDYRGSAEALVEHYKDRFGGWENIKRTFAEDPVGLAADVSLPLTGGGSMAARAPGVVGQIGRATRAVGSAIDPISATGKIIKGAGHVAAEGIGGYLTHTGAESLKNMARAGAKGGTAADVAQGNLRGTRPIEEAAEMAEGAVSQLRKERGAEYTQKIAQLGLDKVPLSFKSMGQALLDAMKIQTFKGQELLAGPQAKIRDSVVNAVVEWSQLPKQYHNADGFDALKRKIGNIRESTEAGTAERKIADTLYRAVRDNIIKQVPEYAPVMKAYERASDLIEQMERTLSINPAATVDTTLRKLQSVLRNNVNTSYGYRAKLVEFLQNAGAPHLLEALSGQALQPWSSRGLGKVGAEIVMAGGSPGRAALFPFFSPRLMGEAAYYAGRASPYGVPTGRAAYQVGREEDYLKKRGMVP